MDFDVLDVRDFVQALFGESHPVWDPFIRVRGPSNGLTDHCGRDGCRGLLMHAGLLFVVFVVCCRRGPQGGHFELIVLRHMASLSFHQ